VAQSPVVPSGLKSDLLIWPTGLHPWLPPVATSRLKHNLNSLLTPRLEQIPDISNTPKPSLLRSPVPSCPFSPEIGGDCLLCVGMLSCRRGPTGRMRGPSRKAACEKNPLTLTHSPKLFAATLPSLAVCNHANNLGERGQDRGRSARASSDHFLREIHLMQSGDLLRCGLRIIGELFRIPQVREHASTIPAQGFPDHDLQR